VIHGKVKLQARISLTGNGFESIFPSLILKICTNNLDGFVKSPTSALGFISLSLGRTKSTPLDKKFARLEFRAFYFAG
jgi:hypothetical protein